MFAVVKVFLNWIVVNSKYNMSPVRKRVLEPFPHYSRCQVLSSIASRRNGVRQ
jgi:hypothetical protein